ncbi:MAG: protein kinase [Planctomycetes bacterium]|nr:protein kinase [Planctomycetota bacterium]
MRTERFIMEQAGLASGLLTEKQIDSAWQTLVESLPAADLSLEEITDQQLSNQMVELGFVNRWQAEQLRQGRTKFTLGPYNILDAIGQGGMGYVFKGEHILLGRIEAIKVLPKQLTDATSIANFRREIRAQAHLDHPNLVRLTYADTDGDTYFLVTEYVPGSDLRRLVRFHGPLSQTQAAILISQTAAALDYVHSRGLIHRDVKPGNLLVTPEGHAKLADLGLAYFSADLVVPTPNKPKHIVGTADYLAPEVVVSPGEVRPISDIYSLGCTLYYAVTGKVPFPGGDTADKLRRHLDELPIPPLRLNSELDPDLIAIIGAMMEKRPKDRIATAAEAFERLKPWVDSAGQSVWQEIGAMAELPDDESFRNAILADTLPAIGGLKQIGGPQETHGHEKDKTDRVSATRRELRGPLPQSTTGGEAEEFPGPGRATKALVALAVLVALAAILLVIFSVE